MFFFPWLQHPLIDNPDFEDDKEVYLLPPMKFVGFELWQVKSGTIFDNILLTDDVEYAAQAAQEIGKRQVIEKEMFDAIQEEQNKEIEVLSSLDCTIQIWSLYHGDAGSRACICMLVHSEVLCIAYVLHRRSIRCTIRAQACFSPTAVQEADCLSIGNPNEVSEK